MTHRLRLLTAALLLAAAPAVAGGLGVLDAVLPKEGDDGTWSYANDGTTFSMLNSKDAGALQYYYADTASAGERTVTVDVFLDHFETSEGFGGLVFSLDTGTRLYHIFALRPNGRLVVLNRVAGGLSPVMESTSDAVKDGWNSIGIAEAGDWVRLLVNGTEIGTIEAEGLGEGAVGVAAAGRLRASFANFSVRDADGPIE